jgi:hypothetical protein
MFYRFAEELVHGTNNTSVIWEVETALSAALTEANESQIPITIDELELQAREVLENKGLSMKMLEESIFELKRVMNTGVVHFQDVVQRLANQSQKDLLKAEFKPDKERILSAINSDGDFAAYLRQGKQS